MSFWGIGFKINTPWVAACRFYGSISLGEREQRQGAQFCSCGQLWDCFLFVGQQICWWFSHQADQTASLKRASGGGVFSSVWVHLRTERSRSCTPQALVRPWYNYQIMNLPHKSKFSWDDIHISVSLFSFVCLHQISSGKTVLNCVKEQCSNENKTLFISFTDSF